MRYYLTNDPTNAGGPSAWYALPITFAQEGGGIKFNRELRKAVASDVWKIVGDGKAQPRPLVLSGVIFVQNNTPNDLRVLERAIRSAASGATAVMRVEGSGGSQVIYRRDVLALLEEPITTSRGLTEALLTLSFGPKGPYWTNQGGTSGQDLF